MIVFSSWVERKTNLSLYKIQKRFLVLSWIYLCHFISDESVNDISLADMNIAINTIVNVYRDANKISIVTLTKSYEFLCSNINETKLWVELITHTRNKYMGMIGFPLSRLIGASTNANANTGKSSSPSGGSNNSSPRSDSNDDDKWTYVYHPESGVGIRTDSRTSSPALSPSNSASSRLFSSISSRFNGKHKELLNTMDNLLNERQISALYRYVITFMVVFLQMYF